MYNLYAKLVEVLGIYKQFSRNFVNSTVCNSHRCKNICFCNNILSFSDNASCKLAV